MAYIFFNRAQCSQLLTPWLATNDITKNIHVLKLAPLEQTFFGHVFGVHNPQTKCLSAQ